MAPSIKDVRTSINRLIVQVEEVESTLEERDRLINVLTLTPSNNDNFELINLIQKLLKHMEYAQDDLIEIVGNGIQVDDLLAQFQGLTLRYEDIVYLLGQEKELFVDTDEYRFIVKEIKKKALREQGPKTVRFKDEEDVQEENLRTELMGTRLFKPYNDEDDSTADAESFDNVTNLQMFAQHQQQLLEQDDDLDVLHLSIQRQHEMGRNINTELDDHLILLNDLEQGVETSSYRLNSATHRLNDFRRRAKENGSLVTIILLTVILVVLLVVLN